MQFIYKVKKRNRDKLNHDYFCEVRTKAPGAHIYIVVHSWLPTIHLSMNGTSQLTLDNLEEIADAVREARVKIDNI